MSKRTERRAAERIARKAAFQQLRQQNAKSHTPNPAVEAAELEPEANLLVEASTEAPAESNIIEADAAPQSPPSISQAQLTANRANAQLSTGPKTEDGKAKSSQNALRHGLTGQTVLLPYESEADYQAHQAIYLEIHQPVTDQEYQLFQSIADAHWRINRVHRLQSGILLKGVLEFADKYAGHTDIERRRLIETDAYLKYEKSLNNLNIQEARLRRIMEKDQAELVRLKTIRKRQEAAEAEAQIRQAKAENGFVFSNRNNQPPADADPSPKPAKPSNGDRNLSEKQQEAHAF
jgi:hypothetical protein